jgi:hypothetical protein
LLLIPAPRKVKKDESESSSHLVASASRLLETTCFETNEDLTRKVANIEKNRMQTTQPLMFQVSFSITYESSDVLEKDVVATQTEDYSGSKLHYKETSKSKCPRCWSLAQKRNCLKILAVQSAKKLEA